MNRTLLLAFSSIVFASSATGQGRYTVNGNISNLPDGTVMALSRLDGRMYIPVCRDTVSDGKFCLSDTISGEERVLYISSYSQGFPHVITKVAVAPGSVTNITGEGRLFPLWNFTGNLPRQESINRFIAAKMPEFEEYLKLDLKESELIEYLFIEKKGAEEYFKPTFEKVDSIRALEAPFESAMSKKVLEYMAHAPVDAEWLDVYRDYISECFQNPSMENADAIKNLSGRLSEDDFNTPDGRVIKQLLDMSKKLQEGDMLPSAEFVDTEGNIHTVNEFPGKYVLLDFWSQACGPCVRSIPEAEEVGEMYADRLALVGVSQDGVEEWRNYVNKQNMKGIQWNGISNNGTLSLYDRFGFTAIPAYVLVAPDAKIVSIWIGYDTGSLKDAIGRLLP